MILFCEGPKSVQKSLENFPPRGSGLWAHRFKAFSAHYKPPEKVSSRSEQVWSKKFSVKISLWKIHFSDQNFAPNHKKWVFKYGICEPFWQSILCESTKTCFFGPFFENVKQYPKGIIGPYLHYIQELLRKQMHVTNRWLKLHSPR